MTAVSKKQERASLLSKRIIRTNKINSNEAIKLQERLDGFAAKHRQRSMLHDEQMMGIKANLNNVVSIKEKMDVSPIRRKFLLDHGVTLQVKDVYMEDFITAVDSSLVRGEGPKFVDRSSDSDSSNSGFGSSVRTVRSSSSSSTLDKFPLHLPLNVLRKKPNSRPASETISTEMLVDEEEEVPEKLRTQSTRVGASGRPLSGKQQKFLYRVITPPIKGRHITEAYKEMEEDEKLVRKLIERKKFHERLKKEEGARKKILREDDSMKLSSQRIKTLFSPQKEEGTEKRHADFIAVDRNEPKELSIASEEDRVRNIEGRTSTSDEEFENLMQKYLQLEHDRKTVRSIGNMDTKGSARTFSSLTIDSRSTCSEDRTNTENALKFTHLASNDSFFSESVDGSKKVAFSQETPEIDSETDGKAVTATFLDSSKWDELATKVRKELKERESAERTVTKTACSTNRRISRISHPTGVDPDEDIIYDARPDRSVAKGYATMQMKIGQRSVSICVPRFKNETVCKEQIAMRANAMSELKVEKVRLNKQLKKPVGSTLT